MNIQSQQIYDLYVVPSFVHHRRATPEWGFDVRDLPFHNLLYVLEGAGRFVCDGTARQVGPGDLVFFPMGCHQYMETEKTALLRLYTVNFRAMLPQESPADVQFPFAFVRHIEDGGVRRRLEALFQRLCHLFLIGQGMRKVQLRETLVELLELAFLCQGQQQGRWQSRQRLDRAVRFMAEHYRQKLTLKEIAAQTGYSVSYFSALFREATGETPISYLLQLRIAKAKQLLSDGMPVKEVAAETGFSDTYYFCNLFRRLEGTSPGRYKKEC